MFNRETTIFVFKSNERSEDFYIGLADFFSFFFQDIQDFFQVIDALRYNALFEFI